MADIIKNVTNGIAKDVAGVYRAVSSDVQKVHRAVDRVLDGPGEFQNNVQKASNKYDAKVRADS